MLCKTGVLGAPTHLRISHPALRPQHRRFRTTTAPQPTQAISQPLDSVPGMLSALQPASLLTVASVVVGLAFSTAMLKAWRVQHTPLLHGVSSPFMQEALARCPTAQAAYSVNALLTNRHVETIAASQLRREPGVRYIRETLRMNDGGTVTVDTEDSPEAQAMAKDTPVILILPGLTGGSHDSYIQHMVLNARRAGFRAVVFNSRGTSDSPVTSAQFYSASFTGDLRVVVKHVAAAYPDAVMSAIGYSLGANILVRYLGEEGPATPIRAAVSMGNPFTLPIADSNWRRGFNKFYDWHLARRLRQLSTDHLLLFEGSDKPFDLELARRADTVRAFDDAITRVSFGFPSVDAYYAGSSSSLSIPSVTIPLLCVQAANDPISPQEAIPFDAIAANPNTALVLTPSGALWTDDVVTEFLRAVLSTKQQPETKAAPAMAI